MRKKGEGELKCLFGHHTFTIPIEVENVAGNKPALLLCKYCKRFAQANKSYADFVSPPPIYEIENGIAISWRSSTLKGSRWDGQKWIPRHE